MALRGGGKRTFWKTGQDRLKIYVGIKGFGLGITEGKTGSCSMCLKRVPKMSLFYRVFYVCVKRERSRIKFKNVDLLLLSGEVWRNFYFFLVFFKLL